MHTTGLPLLDEATLPSPTILSAGARPFHAAMERISLGADLELVVDGFDGAFDTDIFNTPDFHRLHRRAHDGGAAYIQLREIRSNRICGVFHAIETAPGVFSSPARGSYGGYEIADGLTVADIESFVKGVEAVLTARGARQIDIALPPYCYAPDRSALIYNALFAGGYVVGRQELNQAIPVGHAGFAEVGTYSNRKRLNKAVRERVVARKLAPADFPAAYDVLVESRRKKNYPITMSWPQIADMVALFPQALHFFGAEQGGALIATAICVAVSPRILYTYSWGERAGWEALSPVTVLADRIFAFARSAGFDLLDLGTSSLQGNPNPGLFAFKKSLGATPSIKLYFTKALTWTA
jgi:hypothetical protein